MVKLRRGGLKASGVHPGLRPAALGSLRMLRARPLVSLGLGAAVVFSLLSVCCVLGFVTTPWFLCELFALQLAMCIGRPIARSWSFVPAGAILLGAVLLVSAVAWITLLGSGPALARHAPQQFSLTSLMRSGGFYAAVSSGVALLVIAPLLYAPLIILEHGWQLEAALVESVRLVVTRGVFASLGLSWCAHAVQVGPVLIACLVSLAIDPSQLALSALCSAPLLCASVPLGQGMIVWTYTQVREPSDAAPLEPGLSSSARAPTNDTTVAAALRGCAGHARAWTVLIVLPLAALLLVQLSLVVPSRVASGAAPSGEVLGILTPAAEGTVRVVLPDTALEVSATAHEVKVSASDGGGAGTLPLRAAGAIERVRVVRVRDALAVELRQAGRDFVTWVDRAGVRLDDDLRVRLLDRLSMTQILLLLGTLLLTSGLSVPVLNDLGRVQRGYRLPLELRPNLDTLALDRARSESRARRWGLLLSPLSLLCLAIALHAVGAF
jgi:hypothetical protein